MLKSSNACSRSFKLFFINSNFPLILKAVFMLMLINFLFGTNCITEDINFKQMFIYILILDILFNSHVKQFFEICCKAI